MNRPIQDPEGFRRYLEQLAKDTPADIEPPVAEARPCPAPVRPGSHNAAAAFRLGCEDEWIDRMNARYGGEW